MRVSTSQIFDSGTLGILRNQAELFKLQNQLSTGRRILSPQDDPIAATQALNVSQSQAVNTQFLDNQALANDSLSYVDSELGSLSDQLSSILEKTVQGANATLDSTQRGMIAEELKQRLTSVISLANTQDGQGHYIFAGTNNLSKPFATTGTVPTYSLTNPYVTYSGNSTLVAVQASASQTIDTSVDGQSLFLQVRDASGNLTGRSLFDTIKNVIDQLDPSSGVTFSATAMSQGISDLNAAVSHVATVRAKVGANQNALESLTNLGQDQGLQFSATLSKLQDLDYTTAISNLSQVQMQLEAAQLSFKQTSQLSLFSIL